MRSLLSIGVTVATIGLSTGVVGCRDRAQDVTGGRWIGDALEDRSQYRAQRAQNPSAFEIEAPEAPQTDAPERPAPVEIAPPPAVVFDPDDMPPTATVDGVTAEILKEAEALVERGRVRTALAEINRAAAREPEAPEVLLALGRVHARLGNHRDAEVAFGRLLAQKPKVVDALYGKALAHLQLGEIAAAKPLAQTLEGLRPDDSTVRRLAARIAAPSDALKKSRRAAATGDPAALREHADRLARAGQVAESANFYGLAAARFDKDADLHTRWGTALAAGGRLDEAITALETAVRLDPRQLAAWQHLATIHERMGARAKAADALQDLVKFMPAADRKGRIQARITRLRSEP